MSRGISKQQIEVIDQLKEGAVIHVYRLSNTDLRAFMVGGNSLSLAKNVRITTVWALQGKNLIKKTTKVYASDWEGIWAINK